MRASLYRPAATVKASLIGWGGQLSAHRRLTHGGGYATIVSVSEKTTLRLPPALLEQLTQRAAEQGVSLNTLMVALLAGGIGFKLDDN
jgi:hypothetical protein